MLTKAADWCIMDSKEKDSMNDYNYDYHDLVEDADFVDDVTIEDKSTSYPEVYDAYYHSILKEIEENNE